MIWLAAAAVAVAALAVYERFAGEHPLLDAWYEMRLRRLSFAELDRRHRDRQRRTDVIVTLTTLPSRIDRIGPTIKSLLNQTVSPGAIRIHVPAASRREGLPYVVPAWLAALQSVRIVRCNVDYGPATKLIPALSDIADDQRLLVVDDDRIYQPHLVEQFLTWSEARPDAAIAASGWDAPADLTDRPSTLVATLGGRPPAPIKCTRVRGTRDVDVMQGLSGYLVRPRFVDLAAIRDYAGAPDAAFFVDDVWISAHCRVPKVILAGRRTSFPSLVDARFFKRSSVALVNRGGGDAERRNNTIMLRYFAQRWRRSSSRELET
jgi:hypothetical protein